jgi:hypothetical protein
MSYLPGLCSVPILVTALLLGACAGGSGDLTSAAGGGGGGTPITPPDAPPLPPSPALSGLVALAAGDGSLRADFDLPGTGFEAALFFGQERSTLFDGPPAYSGLDGDHVVITNLTNEVQMLVGMAIRPDTNPPGAWTPVGSVLRCHPTSTIVYVDAAANPVGANGTSPQTAYPSLSNGLLRAGLLAFQGATPNVLVAEGTYSDGEFAIAPDVHVYGGFKPDTDFDLYCRDARSGLSLLNGTADPGRMIVDVLSGSRDAVLDGFTVDGRNVITEGVDVTDSECELRSVTVRNLVDRGSRVRTFDFTTRRDVLFVACELAGNGNGGLGISGTVNLSLDRCSFLSNSGEGADFNDMVAAEGTTATLDVVGCRFFGNGTEGLDVDLAPPPFAQQSPGGRFEIRVQGCSFERNGLDGLLIDQDYEFWPNWTSDIRVLDCIACANGDAGVHFDADNPGSYVIDRLTSTANKSEGLLITSETNAGLITVSSSYFGGNQTQGIRTTLGNKMILATHCVFAGNLLAGFTADTPVTVHNFNEGTATSCVAWRQPNPWQNVRATACYVEDAVNPFENAPEIFALATAHLNGELTLAPGANLTEGQTVELADDTQSRLVTSIQGSEIVITPAPQIFVAPDVLFGFGDTSVEDDLRIVGNSQALNTALVAPGAAALDPGPFGMPSGGRPGVYDPFGARPMRLLATTPNITDGAARTQPVILTFDRTVDPATATTNSVRCLDLAGNLVAAQISVAGNMITLVPPAAGWSSDMVIQVHNDLLATDGSPFGGALVASLHIR